MNSIVVMGVAGSGKSSLAKPLAEALNRPFIEGDDFHPPENVAKMRAGQPLDDADRAAWLEALGAELRKHDDGVVLSCSALKRAYRDQLRRADPRLRIVYLALDRDLARQRVGGRNEDHFAGSSLIDSQFEALESPKGEAGVLEVDAAEPIEVLTRQVVDWCGERA
jgi:gluconokinase